jgi:hypothetical protein
MIACTTWSRFLGYLGCFEAWVVLRLGRFVFLMFLSWDVLRLGTFWGLGRFVFWTFWSWDVLRLGPYVFGSSVFGRYVFGRFVGAPVSHSSLFQFFKTCSAQWGGLQTSSVPDSKIRNIPEVVFVRRWAVGVLGIWKGWDSWVKGGANGVSLHATWDGGGRFLSQLEGAK